MPFLIKVDHPNTIIFRVERIRADRFSESYEVQGKTLRMTLKTNRPFVRLDIKSYSSPAWETEGDTGCDEALKEKIIEKIMDVIDV